MKLYEKYKRLYHYTTSQGLLGILENKCLWSTQYKFLNDYSEISRVRDKLIQFLHPYVLELYNKQITKHPKAQKIISENGGLDAVINHDTSGFVDSKYSATGNEIYITSFCGEHEKDEYINKNGLLSQWRGYGNNGGYAIVFETQILEETILPSELEKFDYSTKVFDYVIYSDNETGFNFELSSHLINIAEYMQNVFLGMLLNKSEPPDASKAYPSFINCISRYKDEGFKEENEVRIAILPIIQDEKYRKMAGNDYCKSRPEKQRQFREKNGSLIPYIELFHSLDIDLPIKEIIVGPHKDKEARAAALALMLKDTKIKVSISEIPYIG